MEVCESSNSSTEAEGFDTQLGHHIRDTVKMTIALHCESNRSPLTARLVSRYILPLETTIY